MDLIAGKKQQTLGEPVKVIEQTQKKKTVQKAQTTYWSCEKGHIFRHNFTINKDRAKAGLRYPECNSPAKNKVNENTYIQYRKSTGRADEKDYRLRQAREAEKRLNRMGGP